ncbi:spermatogenesis-associated protein 20 [Blyttiomyces sp. JEL0837]|nr:spermatogenesis-associated protein 20 [Blyttiomyces sp. JEL0837]
MVYDTYCYGLGREERPTVDKMYMTFVQALTGHGGWPMTVFLTPELKPFFGGTYFAPESKYGMPSFPSLLEHFGEKWVKNPDALRAAGDKVMDDLRGLSKPTGDDSGNEKLITWSIPVKTYFALERRFDEEEGGFGSAPKFPTPVTLEFLLTYHTLAHVPESVHKEISEYNVNLLALERVAARYGIDLGDEKSGVEEKVVVLKKGLKDREEQSRKALEMLEFTMTKIAMGGIHDHVGAGFHRYSVDRHWHVPHFEKMLYDQAQLLSVYSSLYCVTKKEAYADVCKDIIKYVQRDLRDPAGGFYSAEDADSLETARATEKREGAFAVWEQKEIDELLGEEAKLFSYHFGVEADGNVARQHDPHGELRNKNVLIQRHTVEETAREFSKDPKDVHEIVQKCFEKLWVKRCTRPKPHRDDKVITSWNGLMISALSKTSRRLNDRNALQLAEQAASFTHQHLYDPASKTLTRSYREGSSSDIRGFADDYAFLIMGLLDLYEASLDGRWLSWARDLQDRMDVLFWDAKDGGYFSGVEDDKNVLLRLKDDHDGAEPTASSVATTNLLRLACFFPDSPVKYQEKATKGILCNIETLSRYSISLPFMVVGCMGRMLGFKEFIVAGDIKSAKGQELLGAINGRFYPLSSLVHSSAALEVPRMETDNAVLKSIADSHMGSDVFVYCCEGGSCSLPVDNVAGLAKLL